MNIKHDNVLEYLHNFGFICQERNNEGFFRYSKRIGDLIITIASGQFENKIRVSLLQDREGKIRTTYKDILAYTDLIGALQDAGLTGIEKLVEEISDPTAMKKDTENEEDFGMLENPLVMFPRKPEGFMI